MFAIWLFGGGALLVSCNNNVEKKTEDPALELRAAWDAFSESWNALDAAGFAAFYTINGVYTPPDFNISQSREEVEFFFFFVFDEPGRRL